jgi:trigger factor
MQTSVTQLGANKVKLTVEVPSSDVEKVLGQTYRRLAAEVRVPGFRPGKAPKAVIDQRLGRDFVRSEALKEVLPGAYADAVRSSEIDVVAPPSIDVKNFEDGQDLTFEATVETRPEAEVSNYEGLPATLPRVEVSDSDVDQQLEQLRVRFASLEVTQRPLQKGDFAQVDLTTYRHDQTVDELTAKDLLVEVGAEMLVAELDNELEGKRQGDILKVTATLPERFGERAGWQVGMQVLVKETKARKLPDLDDELAKTVSEFDTLGELRDDISQRLTEALQERATAAAKDSVIEAFRSTSVEVDLPEGMIDVEIDSLVTGLVQILAAQDVSIERYMEANSLDPEALRQQFREQAEKNLTVRLGLDAVVTAEGLEVSPDERDRELERLAERTRKDPADIRQMIDEGDDWSSVDGDILRAKALDLLVERAEVTEVDPEEGLEKDADKEPA